MAKPEKKIVKITGQNVLVKLANRPAKRNIGTVEKPIMVDNENLYFPTVSILHLGPKADAGLKVGMECVVYAQSLGYNIDNEDIPESNYDKDARYYVIFDEQILMVLDDKTSKDEGSQV